MVASWRVKSVISFSVIFPLAAKAPCFFTFVTVIPWRRKVALTTASPAARISPLTTLPFLSLPSHRKGNLFGCVSCHHASLNILCNIL
jgi:hypothetical protein